MKNREKYREEIVERACDGTIRACEFTRRNVLPKFGVTKLTALGADS